MISNRRQKVKYTYITKIRGWKQRKKRTKRTILEPKSYNWQFHLMATMIPQLAPWYEVQITDRVVPALPDSPTNDGGVGEDVVDLCAGDDLT